MQGLGSRTCSRRTAEDAKSNLRFRAALRLVAMVVATVRPIAIGRAETVTFDKGCAPGTHITIAAVGDLLFNGDLQRFALSRKGSYRRLWQGIEPIIRRADLAYGNLEGPVADITYDGKQVASPGRNWQSPVYRARSRYSSFNYHPSLVADLKRSGFSVVSTANNHALDRGGTGIEQTIHNLERNALAFSGTRKRHETDRPWSVVTKAKGFSLAWVACTYGLNGHPDLWRQVLLCYEQRQTVLDEIRRQASDPTIDAVVLVPHWGTEFSVETEQMQRDFARQAVEAGALLVIGAHPHMVQPWEKLTARDGREALVIYSSGDFVSDELANPHRAGLISLIELLKRPQTSKAYISAAAYLAIKMDRGPPVPHVVEVRSTNSVPQLPRGNRVSLELAFSLPRICP